MPFGFDDSSWAVMQQGKPIPTGAGTPVSTNPNAPSFSLGSINNANAYHNPQVSGYPQGSIYNANSGGLPTVNPVAGVALPKPSTNISTTPINSNVPNFSLASINAANSGNTPLSAYQGLRSNLTPTSASGGNVGIGNGTVDPNARPYIGAAPIPIGSNQSQANQPGAGSYFNPGNSTSTGYDPYRLSGQGQDMNLANMGKMGSSNFLGGASAATPSNNRPLTQGSPTSVGAGNNPNFRYPPTTGNTRERGFVPMPVRPVTIDQIQNYITNHPESVIQDNATGEGSDIHREPTDFRINIPGLGPGIWSSTGGNSGRFYPTDQSGLPGGHYQRFYEIANDANNWNGSAGDTYIPNALQQVVQERSTSRLDRFQNETGHFVDWAVPLGIAAGTAYMGGGAGQLIGQNLASTAGNALGLSAGTLNTVGQAATWANRARQGVGLYNMARQASGGKIGRYGG